MRAVVFYGREDVRVEEVPEPPSPGPGQVKLENAFVGICGSDLHVYFDPERSGTDFTRPHPLTGAMPPQILGHEFSGTVVELGENVTGLAVGDRVTCYSVYWCGACAACREGRHACCPLAGWHGVTSHGGGLAAYTTVSAAQCMKLPNSVDLRTGALVEPMAASWRAARRSGAGPGSTALVIGAGPIGIGAFIALRARGVERILVTEPSPERRAAIGGLGATHVVDPATTDLGAAVAELSDGEGIDVAIDAAGKAGPLAEAMRLLRAGGIAVVLGVHAEAITVDPLDMLLRELTLTCVKAYDKTDFAQVIEAMSRGLYPTTGWVSEVALEDTERTIHELHSGVGVKAMVRVADESTGGGPAEA